MNIAPAPVTRCRRSGCNRPLTSPASVARGYGRACAAKERAERETLDAALAIATAPYSARQKRDANELIAAGKLKPLAKRGLWAVTSSDGVTVYRTTALGCNCPSHDPCKHMCAVALRETAEALGISARRAA